MRTRTKAAGGLLALALATSGCTGFLTNFAAGSSVRVFSQAAPGLQRWADPDLAEAAIPGSLATLEGLLIVQPENPTLRLTLARTHASYGFGWLEDRMESAEVRGEEEVAAHYRARASNSYLRARAVGFELMSLWEPDDGGVEGHLRGQIDTWRNYLLNFDRPEQGPHLFWAAYSWARWVGLNRDNVDAIADLPYVEALALRARQLDESFNGFAPIALVAGLQGARPAAIGGRPDLAREGMEDVIRRTERKNLMILVLEARVVAVALQDRALFESLLREVLDAGDVDPLNRLQNQLAKRRARRYLAQIDDLFMPALDGPGDGSDSGAGGEAPPSEGSADGASGG